MDIKTRKNEAGTWRLSVQRIPGRRYIPENYSLHRDTDIVLIPKRYPDTRIFIFVSIILRFLFTDVSGTDIPVVSMRICRNQECNSGRKNLKRM